MIDIIILSSVKKVVKTYIFKTPNNLDFSGWLSAPEHFLITNEFMPLLLAIPVSFLKIRINLFFVPIVSLLLLDWLLVTQTSNVKINYLFSVWEPFWKYLITQQNA